MVELRFRIRSTVFTGSKPNEFNRIQPLILVCKSLEQAAMLGEVNKFGGLVPNKKVFSRSFHKGQATIEGFKDCALGEFMKAQMEALSKNGIPSTRCEIHGIEPFMGSLEHEGGSQCHDLISICPFKANEFTPESAVSFLKESGFNDEYIIVGVKHGKGWRRSRCITTFEGRPLDAATILGYMSDYFNNVGYEKTKGDESE